MNPMPLLLTCLLAPALALAQGSPMLVQPVLKAEAACVVGWKGEISRVVFGAKLGAVATQTAAQHEFDLKIPGRLEEWESPNGSVEFRFFPEPGPEGKTCKFTMRVRDLHPMAETKALIEGGRFMGMSAWYLGAPSRGAGITAYPGGVSLQGRVVSSTIASLASGLENLPVSANVIPRIAREFEGSQQPLVRFPGKVDLWALRTATDPFTAVGEIRYEHKSDTQEIKGTFQVSFELAPAK